MKFPLGRVSAVGFFAAAPVLLSSCTTTAAQNEPPSPVSAVTSHKPATVVPVALNASVVQSKRVLPRALWVWDATVITNPKQGADLFAFCAKKGVSVIYLDMGDLFLPEQRQVGDPKHITASVLGRFLKAAHAKKLQVEALDGAPEFALETKHAEALGHLKKALAYNKAAASGEKLDGFQWDTEPYILAQFKAGGASQTRVLTQYLDSVAQMRDAIKKGPPLRLGYAIPAFFDDKERTVAWRGASKPAAFHLMDILNTLPSGYVAMMAYRDKALGTNGTVDITQKEVDYATQHAPKVKVWIGQETLDVTGDPPSITFYQEGENALEQALGQIQDAYKTKPVVAGLAIHHWDSYRVMKAGDAIAAVQATAPITEPLTILTPKANDAVARRMEVTGTAKPGGTGAKVEVAVRPNGDIWYAQGDMPVAANGTWSVTSNFGNEKTPSGGAFEVRAQLKKADGAVVTKKIVNVKLR